MPQAAVTVAVTPIEAIKSALTITEALEQYAGANISGRTYRNKMQICCPFHDDRSPSMTVYLDTNKCRCWTGSCIAHGHANDQIDVVQLADGVSRKEAIHRLMKDLGLSTGKDTQKAVQRAHEQSALDTECRVALKAIRRLMNEMDFARVDVFRDYDKPVDCGSVPMGDEVMNMYSKFYHRLQVVGSNLMTSENEQEKRAALWTAEQLMKEVKQFGK